MTFHFSSAEPDEVWPLIRDYHYSRRMPGNIQHCYVWRKDGGLFGNHGDPVATTVWSIPPTRWSENVLELTRLVRSEAMEMPLSSLVKASCEALRHAGHVLLVSFADKTQGHHGGIYQSCSWQYGGYRKPSMDGCLIDGVFVPGRSLNSKHGTRSPDLLSKKLTGHKVEPHYDAGKHIYWKALTIAGKTRSRRLGLASLPYPKPNATCPADAPVPTDASREHPPEVAPIDDTYDAAKDGHDSYYEAIAEIRRRKIEAGEIQPITEEADAKLATSVDTRR